MKSGPRSFGGSKERLVTRINYYCWPANQTARTEGDQLVRSGKWEAWETNRQVRRETRQQNVLYYAPPRLCLISLTFFVNILTQ